MDCVLFGHHQSGHSYKVKLMLEVARVPHAYHLIDITLPHDQRPEPFRSLAPYGEVPLFLCHGRTYAQSNAILLKLAEETGRFGGESPERLARAREWLFWESNRLGFSLPHLRYARHIDPTGYPEGTLDWLTGRYMADITRVETELKDGRAFVLDDTPSVADFSLCGYLFWADQAQVHVPSSVLRWLDRIRQLPGWAAPEMLLKPTTI